jgi:hypothetical protein
MSLLGKIFPTDNQHPGVGPIGKAFLKAFNPKPERPPLFGPASSWTQRKPQPTPPDAYAPKITREHRPWPGAGQGGGHQPWPYQPWPGGDGRGR